MGRNFFSKTAHHNRTVRYITYIKRRPITNLIGLHYIVKYLAGMNITQIAKMAKHDPRTVVKYMASAATMLIEDAHTKMIQDLVPLAQQVYTAKLKSDLEKLAKGEVVDLKDAERVLQGMLVFDSPQLKKAVAPEDKPEIESLGMVVAKLRDKRKPIELSQNNDIEGEVIKSDKDNPVV